MSKRFLLDFSDGVAVVFFALNEREYARAFTSRWDLWDFFEKAPAAVSVSLKTETNRRKARLLATTNRIDLFQAVAALSELPKEELSLLSSTPKATTPRAKLDLSKIEF